FQVILHSRIWLILLFFTPATVTAEAQSTTMIKIPKCSDEMTCFTSNACMGGRETDILSKMIAPQVKSDCPAVLEIRNSTGSLCCIVSMQQSSRSLLNTALIRCSPV
ncbi:hypothetical protein PFISCL1PPCAC_11520, partial [Pristionchus fissidentatus]